MPQAPKSTPVRRPPAQQPAKKKAPPVKAQAKPAAPKAPATRTTPAPQTRAAANAGSTKAGTVKAPATGSASNSASSQAASKVSSQTSAPSSAPSAAPSPAPSSAPASSQAANPASSQASGQTSTGSAAPSSAPAPAPAPAPPEAKPQDAAAGAAAPPEAKPQDAAAGAAAPPEPKPQDPPAVAATPPEPKPQDAAAGAAAPPEPKPQDPPAVAATPPANPLSSLWNSFGFGGKQDTPKPAEANPAQSQANPAQTNPAQPGTTEAKPPASGDAGAAAADGKSSSPGLFDRVTGLFGSAPPKLTSEQQQALDFARSMMGADKLGGVDGRFNQGDVEAIARAVANDRGGIKNLVLSQTTNAQEYNVANEVLTNGVNGTGARRDILSLADQRINNQVTGTIREQLSSSLTQQGVKGPADGKPDLTNRNVTIQEMARFEESMKVIEAMTKGKMSLPGMVATLPQGPSAQTFADLVAGKTIPEGVSVAMGDSTGRGGSTASTAPGGTSPSGGTGTATTPPPSLREQLRLADIAAGQPKPSSLPPNVRQAAQYVEAMLSSNKLGGGDLTLNHGDIPAVASALRSDVNGIRDQVMQKAGGGIRGFAARRALNGHNGPFARQANQQIADGIYSDVRGQLGSSLSQSGVTGNNHDRAGRNLTVSELEGFKSSMAVVQQYGDQMAAANGFRLDAPSSGIPRQMFSDLLNDRIPQFGTVQVTNPGLATGASMTRPSTSSRPAPSASGQPAPPNSGFGSGANSELRPSAVGPNTTVAESPSNNYVRTSRGLVPMEHYSPEMRQQFGLRSNVPYTPQGAPRTSQPTQAQSSPVQSAPAQSAPAQSAPAQSAPAQSAPAQSSQTQSSQSSNNSAPVFLGTSPSNRYYETPQGLVPVESYQSRGNSVNYNSGRRSGRRRR
jgi:hypothetical protein